MLHIFPSSLKARPARSEFVHILAHEALKVDDFARRGAGLLPKGRVVLCGDASSSEGELQGFIHRQNARLTIVSDDALTVDWLHENAGDIDVLVVDADFLGDIEDTIDFCIRVRRAAPQLPLILLSSEMRGNDYTCERMMACDATLKLPISDTTLTTGLQAAYENNRYFVRTGL